MELKQAIINRRSYKKYDHDTTVSDTVIEEAVALAAYAPNHGMREPWRVIWIKKDRLAEFAALFADFAFKNEPEKKAKHIDTLTKLSGLLVIVGNYDRRQKQFLEDVLAVGAFLQTLSLVLHEAGVGSCIKTPGVITAPGLNDSLDIAADEMIYGFVYLTDTADEVPLKERNNSRLLTEW
ncbi:nitroreductase [Macrococcus equipercicus]|uniref:Nitroreductase n=1 Tax=Macrococcus equipercicus TaxID=69967 RepID=A0ABQ6RBE5_9STAP|nr:nitroreductase family protein [Macrococcus equipercicus]KAA1042509.1 nitroreductase [Macrococcus equipercicus]